MSHDNSTPQAENPNKPNELNKPNSPNEPNSPDSPKEPVPAASPTFWSRIKTLIARFLRLFKRDGSPLARYILRLAAFALLIFALFWGIDRLTPKKDLFGFLKPKPIEIEETQNLVVSIRNIAELHSASFCGEYLVKNSKSRSGDKKDSIYIIVKSHIHAGFDLSQIQPCDITLRHDTLDIIVPPVRILDAIINPSDIEIFAETGSWSDAQIQQTVLMGRKDIQQIAIRHGLLTKAQESGLLLLENIFRTFGYDQVNITIAPQ